MEAINLRFDCYSNYSSVPLGSLRIANVLTDVAHASAQRIPTITSFFDQKYRLVVSLRIIKLYLINTKVIVIEFVCFPFITMSTCHFI